MTLVEPVYVCAFHKVKARSSVLFFKPNMEEYKKITVNVLNKKYNITHINVYMILQSITVFLLPTF